MYCISEQDSESDFKAIPGFNKECRKLNIVYRRQMGEGVPQSNQDWWNIYDVQRTTINSRMQKELFAGKNITR